MNVPSTIRFVPQDWYWVTANGRVYSSRRNGFVASSDPTYLDFVATQGGATKWPLDASGRQTSDSLAQVLAFYGITATPPSP